MEKINSLKDFNDLVSLFKESNPEIICNFPINRGVFSKSINEGTFFGCFYENGLYFFIDEDNYYVLYYIIQKDSLLERIMVDKDVLINEAIIIKKERDDFEIKYDELLLNSNFEIESVNLQFEINVDEKKEEIKKVISGSDSYFKKKDYWFEIKDMKENHDVIALWNDNLKKTDIPKEHYNSGKVLCVFDRNNQLIAVGWFNLLDKISEWRHVIVSNEHRDFSLALIMYYLWMEQALQHGITKGIGWVEKENKPSLAMNDVVGFKRNGRVSIQYVLKKEKMNYNVQEVN